jgi:hypothetical protein
MQRILVFASLALAASLTLTANIFTDGLKKVGQGAAATGKLAGRGAVAAGKGVGKGAKKGTHGLARGTEKGASKIADKTK